MDETEFDKFAEEYHNLHAKNIKLTGEDPSYFYRYKVKDLLKVLYKKDMINDLKILDFGSGIGNSIPFFKEYFPKAKLHCLDVSQKSLEIAIKSYKTQAKFIHFNGNKIPYPDNFFNVVFSSCVFHHIKCEEHSRLLKEIWRVLKPTGNLMIFEHNPLNPLTKKAVKDCPFDNNAVLIRSSKLKRSIKIAGFSEVKSYYRIFFPKVLKIFRSFEPFLTWLPFGAQYYVLAKKD